MKKKEALDLSIFKDITTSEGIKTTTQIIELPSIIDVTVDIPADYLNKSDYVIYRNHEGEVDILTSTKNSDGEYVEVPLTADNTPIMVCVLLALSSMTVLTLTRKKQKNYSK